MTLALGEAETKMLDELCLKKDLTKTAAIRQAIRLYFLVDSKLADGAKLLLQEASDGHKSELMVL